VTSAPNFASADLTFGAMSLAVVIGCSILLAYPRGVAREWMEWLYVHMPSGAAATDAHFAKVVKRYRIYSLFGVVIGISCVWSTVSSIFS
jgi:hypothetical protein